ncbi:MAG: T9SS type A sorting domain-containing protein [Ferruginibacter sp.]
MKKYQLITGLCFAAAIMISAKTIDPVLINIKQSTGVKIANHQLSNAGDVSTSRIPGAITVGKSIMQLHDQPAGLLSPNNKALSSLKANDTTAYCPMHVLATDASVGSIIDPASGSICSTVISPKITIRNIGTDILNSVEVGMILDGSPLGDIIVLENLALATATSSAAISLSPDFTPDSGTHQLKVYTRNPNGNADAGTGNDTATVSFTVTPTLALTYKESFESETFPVDNGSDIINEDAGSVTWTRSPDVGNVGDASMLLNAFLYEEKGERDIYRTPKINVRQLDSVVLFFSVAYKQYEGAADSLLIVYSPDCGNTWLPTSYAKGGATLSTSPGTTAEEFIPTDSEWRVERVVLQDFCTSDLQSVMFGFESYNGYGNNIYVDGINIAGFARSARNIKLSSVSQPQVALCSNDITPAVSFRNEGIDTIRSLKVNYQVDGGAITTLNWTGSLPKCETASVTSGTSVSTPGLHEITVFTSDPNGLNDFAASNDTLRKTFTIYNNTPVATPVSQGFETTGIPDWGVQNFDRLITWDRSTAAAKTGVGSLWINNPATGNGTGTLDNFVSPVIENNTTIDSMFVTWDYAYQAGARYPGSTVLPLDTLEVLVTGDCGATFTSVWKKWGEELQTINDPNYSSSTTFVPANAGEWKMARVYLSPAIGTGSFQVYFSAKSNKQNNIWLDNISITSKTLPQRLKNQGYLIYPNPFTNSFLVHHTMPPVDLQAILVYNSTGQLVRENLYNGNATTEVNINLGNLSRGIYILKMIYSNKTVVERVVKN